MTFGPKHQRKVNECYPTRPGEEGAVSGKISVLTYYINAKPEKLQKVSVYLEKKVRRDVQRERTGYNKVTLEIVEGIMNGCSDFFGSFALTAVTIIDVLSEAPEAELIVRTASTFNRLYDAETRTIQGLVGMEDFRAHGGQDRLDTLLRAIIAHMEAEKSECETINNAYVSLIRGLPFPSFPIFMTAFFQMVGDSCKSSSCDKCPAIGNSLQLLARHAPSGILCIFLTEIFRQLERATEPVLSLLVDTLADLLLSNRGPLGYTALDISSNLMKLLRKQRPPAPPDTRRSILQPTLTSPPRAVFAISNCLVSILRNTNFAAQKYDIINSIILRAFLPREARRPTTGAGLLGLDSQHRASTAAAMAAAEHHSLATVTLDNQEEAQFRAVTWSVLFAMAEEALPATILKLAFVEIPQRLFDSLFMMAVNSDDEFRLNSLVLLHRLLLNGLSFTGHVAKRESREVVIGSSVLSKGSLSLLAKFRSTIFQSFRLENTAAPHICAIDGILRASVAEADLQHCLLTIIMLLSLQDAMKSRPMERQVLTQLLIYSFLHRVALALGIVEAREFVEKRRAALSKQGVNVFDLEGALDDYPPPLCIRSSTEPILKDTAVTFEQARDLLLLLPMMTVEQEAMILGAFTDRVPYSPETDLETIKETGKNEKTRRSLFPASPKRPLPNAGGFLGSESASSTILAHHRHSITGFLPSDGSQTIPSFTKHSGGSSISVASSSHLSRASSIQKKGAFRSLNASADSLSLASSNDSQDSAGSQASVLEGDFANLTLRNQERARELRERSTSILQ